MSDDISTEIERPAEHRGREGVVNDQRQPERVGGFGETFKVGDIECRISLIYKAKQTFKDNGHAIAWCMAQK